MRRGLMRRSTPVESFRTHLRQHHFPKSAQRSAATCDSARCTFATGVGRGVGESRSSRWSVGGGVGIPVAPPLGFMLGVLGLVSTEYVFLRLPQFFCPGPLLQPSTLPFLTCRYF